MPRPVEVERLLADASSRLGAERGGDARAGVGADVLVGAGDSRCRRPVGAPRRRRPRRIRLRLLVGLDRDDRRVVGAAARPTRRGSAAALDDSFSIVLLVVAPDAPAASASARDCCPTLAGQADETVTWLQTGADSALHALCACARLAALATRRRSAVIVAARSHRSAARPTSRSCQVDRRGVGQLRDLVDHDPQPRGVVVGRVPGRDEAAIERARARRRAAPRRVR